MVSMESCSISELGNDPPRSGFPPSVTAKGQMRLGVLAGNVSGLSGVSRCAGSDLVFQLVFSVFVEPGRDRAHRLALAQEPQDGLLLAKVAFQRGRVVAERVAERLERAPEL